MKNYEMITVKEYLKKVNDSNKYLLTSVDEYLKELKLDSKEKTA